MNTKKFKMPGFYPQITLMNADLFSAMFSSAKICVICGRFSAREIEIRAAHEIMAVRTTQLALFVDQLMPALQAKLPVFAGNVLSDEVGQAS
jgi:hypothetical protein